MEDRAEDPVADGAEDLVMGLEAGPAVDAPPRLRVGERASRRAESAVPVGVAG